MTTTCPGCMRTMPVKLIDDSVTVGEHRVTETVNQRYCDDCQRSFLAELPPRGVPSPGVRHATGTPYAVFAHYQPAFQDLPPIAMYNIRGPHQREGSTVSAKTLRELGIEVPETPKYHNWESMMSGDHSNCPCGGIL